jgi:hypothetical protein
MLTLKLLASKDPHVRSVLRAFHVSKRHIATKFIPTPSYPCESQCWRVCWRILENMCVLVTVVTYLLLKYISECCLLTAANIYWQRNMATNFMDVTAYFASKGKAIPYTGLDRPLGFH